jgi:hypothetical protein
MLRRLRRKILMRNVDGQFRMCKRCGVSQSDSCGDDFFARSAFRGFGNEVIF